MVKITPDELGVEEDLGRRVLVRARTIAPCIDSFPEGSEERKDAVAILKGVAAEALELPPRSLRSTGVGPMREEYRDVASCFSADDAESLRSLCGPSDQVGLPLGAFPVDEVIGKMWPERYE